MWVMCQSIQKKLESLNKSRYTIYMNITRRQTLLVVWALSIIAASVCIARVTGEFRYGTALGFSLIAISLGVPLMRAFTEFSK